MIRKTRIIGLALTVVFLALVLWNTDFASLGKAFSTADYVFVIPAAMCTLLSYVARTVRWRRILLPTKRIGMRRLFPVLVIGFMANNVLPARIGEVVRAYTLGRKESVSKSLGLATIMLERLLDGLVLVGMMAVISLLVALPEWGFEIAYVASGVFLAASVGVLVLLLWEEFARRVIAFALRLAPTRFSGTLSGWADSFILGLHALKRKRVVILLLAYSAVVWLIEASSYFLVISAFNLGLPPLTTVLAAFLTLVVVNLGILIPSAPGYVGTFQFFGVLALSAFGVPKEQALSVAILSHGVQYVLVTGLGLLFVSRENMSVARMGRDVAVDPVPVTADVRIRQ